VGYGVRYVDNGDVITAAGVLSGVDAALRVVERMVGQEAAEEAAQAVAWPDYSPGAAAPIPRLRPAPADTVGLLSAAADGPATPERLSPVYLHTAPGFGFDAALRDIARTWDVSTARWVAKTLQYPNTNPQLSGPAWPWDLTLRPILIAVASAAAVMVIIKIMESGRRKRPAVGRDRDLSTSRNSCQGANDAVAQR
jgi:hypothetical protein